MSDLHPESLTRQLLHSGVIRWALLLFTVGISGAAIFAATLGGFQQAAELASVAAALATVLLVSLTSQYAEQTKQLVEESRNDRKHRAKLREAEERRETDSLRRALGEEIGKVQYFDDLADSYGVEHSAVGIPVSSTIYESNTDKIGLLTEEEVDNIVEYYTRLERVDRLMELQRQKHTVLDMNFLEEFFRRTEGVIRSLPSILTGGRFGKTQSEDLENEIREQLDLLAKAQERALSAIAENLEQDKTQTSITETVKNIDSR